MQASLIAGLPGSGKSTLARQMSLQVGGHLLDDPPSPADICDVPDGTDHIIACHPDFCRAAARALVDEALRAAFPDIELKWLFFENDPASCHHNVEIRDDGRNVASYIRRLSSLYVIPEGADVRPVFKVAGTANSSRM